MFWVKGKPPQIWPDYVYIISFLLQVYLHPVPIQSSHTKEHCRNRGLIRVSTSTTFSSVSTVKILINSDQPGYVRDSGKNLGLDAYILIFAIWETRFPKHCVLWHLEQSTLTPLIWIHKKNELQKNLNELWESIVHYVVLGVLIRNNARKVFLSYLYQLDKFTWQHSSFWVNSVYKSHQCTPVKAL